jgi:hypothetical protein
MERQRKPAQPLRQQAFQPQRSALSRRKPARAHRDQHRIAIDQRGHGEIAQLRAVGDVDQQARARARMASARAASHRRGR